MRLIESPHKFGLGGPEVSGANHGEAEDQVLSIGDLRPKLRLITPMRP